MCQLLNLNFWAITIAALVYFFIGFIWYSPILFSTQWAKATNISQEESQKLPVLPIIGQLLSSFLYSAGIACVLRVTGCTCIFHGLITAFIIIGLFIFPLNTGLIFFQKKYTLFFIDAGYQSIGAIIISLILSIWK